jgi:tRNA uridine 5-carboxymethylaminomethyl modification enzyme
MSLTVTPNEAGKYGLALKHDGVRRSAFELLSYPEIGWAEVQSIWPEISSVAPAIATHLEIDAKYDVYLRRQNADVDSFRRDEGLLLVDIDYDAVGQAGRMDGLTPAALGILAAYLRRESRKPKAAILE